MITYDTMILAFSFLMIAHVLYLAYQKEQVQIWDWIPSMVCMAVLLPVKIVYVFLALLLILIPKEKYRIPFGNWLGIGAALLGGFLASAAVKATGAADILSRQSWTVPWGVRTSLYPDLCAAKSPGNHRRFSEHAGGIRKGLSGNHDREIPVYLF